MHRQQSTKRFWICGKSFVAPNSSLKGPGRGLCETCAKGGRHPGFRSMLFVAPTATRDPDTSKHMCDYRCAFTSTQSNWAGKATAECWKYTKPWAFVRCDACPDGPVHRCTECYTKYGTTMRRRVPEIEKHQGAKCVTRPELEALL